MRPVTHLHELLQALDSSRTSQTAGNILDAARMLFLESGLRRTTMEDVARQAGIGRITIYRHYEDKHALFQTVVLREAQQALQEIEAALRGISCPDQRFTEGFVLVVNGVRRHPLITRLLQTEPEWLLPYLTVDGTAMLNFGRLYVSSFFRQQDTRHFLRDELDADMTAELLWRLLHSIVLTPGGQLAPETGGDDHLRHIARTFLLPLLTDRSAARD